jgi:hypothetical protein
MLRVKDIDKSLDFYTRILGSESNRCGGVIKWGSGWEADQSLGGVAVELLDKSPGSDFCNYFLAFPVGE